MKKKIVAVLLFSLLAIASAHAERINGFVQQKNNSVEENLVLASHLQVIQWVEAYNVAFIQTLKSCYCLKNNLGNCEKADGNFLEKFINGMGDIKETQRTCDYLVQEYIDKDLDKNFKEMRVSLSLASPEFKSSDIENLFLSNDLSPQYYSHANLSHFIDLTSALSAIPPRTDEETVAVQEKLQEERKKTCQRFYNDNLNIFQPYLHKNDVTCEDLISLRKFKGNTNQDLLMTQTLNSLEAFVYDRLLIFRRTNMRHYFRAIHNHPLFVFLKNEKPTVDEIYKALGNYLAEARERAAEPKAVGALWFVENQWAMEFTSSVLKKYNLNFDDAIESLTTRGNNISVLKSAAVVAGVAAVAYGCFVLPEGLTFKLLNLAITKNICLRSALISFNSYFLIEGFVANHNLMNLLRSSVDSEQSPTDPKELLNSVNQAKLSAALMLVL